MIKWLRKASVIGVRGSFANGESENVLQIRFCLNVSAEPSLRGYSYHKRDGTPLCMTILARIVIQEKLVHVCNWQWKAEGTTSTQKRLSQRTVL